jgi:two-component system, NarL family, nitrate/nitrite response regulator NarL
MRLILGDDQAVFLDALATVLTQRGFEVGAVARSTDEMIAHVARQRPEVCLVDCDPGGPGATAIRRVRQASGATAVLVLGADPAATAAELALAAGACGYVHQSRGVEVLVAALERITSGQPVIDVPDARPVHQPRRLPPAHTGAATLTGRERECLGLLVAGLDTTAIMARMGVSRTTVRTHLQAVLTKLGVHSRLEAASFAVRHRLLDTWAQPEQPVRYRPVVRYRPIAPPVAAAPSRTAGERPALRPAVGEARGRASGRPWDEPGHLAASGLPAPTSRPARPRSNTIAPARSCQARRVSVGNLAHDRGDRRRPR